MEKQIACIQLLNELGRIEPFAIPQFEPLKSQTASSLGIVDTECGDQAVALPELTHLGLRTQASDSGESLQVAIGDDGFR
jgi:hypothetical protein